VVCVRNIQAIIKKTLTHVKTDKNVVKLQLNRLVLKALTDVEDLASSDR